MNTLSSPHITKWFVSHGVIFQICLETNQEAMLFCNLVQIDCVMNSGAIAGVAFIIVILAAFMRVPEAERFITPETDPKVESTHQTDQGTNTVVMSNHP